MTDTALARLSLLKSVTFLNATDTSVDDEIGIAIKQASGLIGTFTSREFKLTTNQNERYTGNGTTKLFLRNWPVTSVVEVRIWDGSDSYDVETAATYEIINERYLQYPVLGQESNATYANWTGSYQNGIKVTYISGYDTSHWDNLTIAEDFPVPPDLEYVAAEIAQLIFDDGKRARRGLMSKSISSESMSIESYVRGIPERSLLILNQYRNMQI